MAKRPFETIVETVSPGNKLTLEEWYEEYGINLNNFKRAVEAKMATELRFHKTLAYMQWKSLFGSWVNEHKGWVKSSTIKGSILDYQIDEG